VLPDGMLVGCRYPTSVPDAAVLTGRFWRLCGVRAADAVTTGVHPLSSYWDQGAPWWESHPAARRPQGSRDSGTAAGRSPLDAAQRGGYSPGPCPKELLWTPLPAGEGPLI